MLSPISARVRSVSRATAIAFSSSSKEQTGSHASFETVATQGRCLDHWLGQKDRCIQKTGPYFSSPPLGRQPSWRRLSAPDRRRYKPAWFVTLGRRTRFLKSPRGRRCQPGTAEGGRGQASLGVGPAAALHKGLEPRLRAPQRLSPGSAAPRCPPVCSGEAPGLLEMACPVRSVMRAHRKRARLG